MKFPKQEAESLVRRASSMVVRALQFQMMTRALERVARFGPWGGALVLVLGLMVLASCQAKHEVVVTMSKEGKLTLQNEPVALDQLPQKLADVARQNPGATVVVQAERGVSWEQVVKVFDAAKAARVSVVSAAVKPTAPTDWSGKRFREMPRPPLRPAMFGQASDAEVDALEARLREDPEDFEARRDLLEHYRFDSTGRAKHLLWIIEHHPEFTSGDPTMRIEPYREGAAFREGKALWLKNVKDHPTNTVILGNAAAYFEFNDPGTAVELLTKAQILEPTNPKWSDRLGHYYSRMATGDTNLAAKALAQFERAQTSSTAGDPRFEYMAKMALAAGDLGKARTYANELLGPGLEWSGGGNAGSALYTGKTVLGRVALREGKVDEAKRLLLEAGATKGSPTLGSFGPNMALAKELLKKGETNTVLEFFSECERFWPNHGGENKLQKWTEQVKEGKMPDFGANLVY